MVDTHDESPPDDLAACSDEERAAASALAAALDRPSGHADATFLRAVALAHAPTALEQREHEALISRALTRPRAADRGSVVRRVSFGVAAALSVAAALALLVRTSPTPTGPTRLAAARSTQALFDQPFQAGAASARIDRIAVARQADLRDNRFAQWGVR